jgi:lambda repressor-like predicted transcriptional regulator
MMKKEEITNHLRQQSGTIAQFAEENEIRRPLVYAAINGKGTVSARMVIAKAIGKRPSEIWPERRDMINERDDAVFLMEK